MARKPVLEGGKRDEIIAAASRLFFTEGYENTSVRKILNSVGGEVGMFYHYFESKEELFDIVADRFFRQYEESFRKMASGIRTPEEFAERFLELYDTAMKQYGRIERSMHWTIRSAFHERTVQALVPTAAELLKQFGASGKYPMDITAAKATADLSAAIHSKSFAAMNPEEQKAVLVSLINDNLK